MKQIELDLDNVHNAHDLKDSLDALMDYPNWHANQVDEWIEMVSVCQQNLPSIPHLRASKQELFIIRLKNAEQLMLDKPGLFRQLVGKIVEINGRYAEKTGNPIISLAL